MPRQKPLDIANELEMQFWMDDLLDKFKTATRDTIAYNALKEFHRSTFGARKTEERSREAQEQVAGTLSLEPA